MIDAKLLAALFAVSVAAAALGCDNIYAPLEKRGSVAEKKEEDKGFEFVMNENRLEEFHKLMSNVRDMLHTRTAEVLEMKDKDEYSFIEQRSKFMNQADRWKILLTVRREWLDAVEGDFSEDHPVPLLRQAGYRLDKQIRDNSRALYGHNEFRPELNEDTREYLEKTKEGLKKYQGELDLGTYRLDEPKPEKKETQ